MASIIANTPAYREQWMRPRSLSVVIISNMAKSKDAKKDGFGKVHAAELLIMLQKAPVKIDEV
jgi:hypothetical protein